MLQIRIEATALYLCTLWNIDVGNMIACVHAKLNEYVVFLDEQSKASPSNRWHSSNQTGGRYLNKGKNYAIGKFLPRVKLVQKLRANDT